MKIIHNTSELEKGSYCVSYGAFDGVHIGHRAVIEKMITSAGTSRTLLISVGSGTEPYLYTEEEKAYVLRDSGLDYMISVSERDSVRDILNRVDVSHVVMGERDIHPGENIVSVPMVMRNGEPVSSGMVKEALGKNDISALVDLLGGPYIMRGIVVHGKGLGKKHGMPTANLGLSENRILPPYGVYGTVVDIDGKHFRGLTNIGPRPSVDDSPVPTVETYIPGYDHDDYGKTISLEMLLFVRGIIKFSGGIDEVKKQIDKDLQYIQTNLTEDDLK